MFDSRALSKCIQLPARWIVGSKREEKRKQQPQRLPVFCTLKIKIQDAFSCWNVSISLTAVKMFSEHSSLQHKKSKENGWGQSKKNEEIANIQRPHIKQW